ncbi:hypothetical protein N752_15235 [Desulforamulus aquiferis]|nr:hypothetical protein N752_15235 [Desulforamulus aquiferis]
MPGNYPALGFPWVPYTGEGDLPRQPGLAGNKVQIYRWEFQNPILPGNVRGHRVAYRSLLEFI